MSIEAVARRASFAEGSRGRGAPLWESRGRSPLGKVRRQQQKPSQSQHSPKQTQSPKCGAAEKRRTLQSHPTYQMRRPNQPRISNTAVLLMSAKPAKSEAILRRTNIKPKQGRQPLPVHAGSVIFLSKSLLCTVCLSVLRFFCRSFKGVRP